MRTKIHYAPCAARKTCGWAAQDGAHLSGQLSEVSCGVCLRAIGVTPAWRQQAVADASRANPGSGYDDSLTG